jgi:hypothetical protein
MDMPQSMRGSIIATAGLPLKRAATINVAYGAVDHGMEAVGHRESCDGYLLRLLTPSDTYFSRAQFELIAIIRGLALGIYDEMAARFCG